MITLKLSVSLSNLLPPQEHGGTAGRPTIEFETTNWPETAEEIARRFERLANHIFDTSGGLRPGLLVAVNDVVSKPGRPPEVGQGDEIYLFQQMAGG